MRTGDLNVGLFLVSALLLASCSTVTQLEPQLVSERLPFIQDGKTSKEEILSRLGEPYNRYQGAQILTYEMCEDFYLKGRLHIKGTRPTGGKTEAQRTTVPCPLDRRNKLILVFGPDNLVARHSVVLVK